MTNFVVSHVQGECLSLTAYKNERNISFWLVSKPLSPPWFGWWFLLALACGGVLAGGALYLFRHGGRFGFVFSLGCID